MSTEALSGPRRSGRKVIMSVALLVVSALCLAATWAAFSDTTSNEDNFFDAGTVVLSDNDLDAKMFDYTNGKPDDTQTSCIEVTYEGTLDADVKLYAASTSTTTPSLAAYTNVTITRGSGAAGFGDCTGFVADTTGSLIYSGEVGDMGTAWASGHADPAVWSTNDTAVYKFEVEIQDDNAAQDLDASTTFTWEAQNR